MNQLSSKNIIIGVVVLALLVSAAFFIGGGSLSGTAGDSDNKVSNQGNDQERVSYCHIAGLAEDPANTILHSNMPLGSLNGHFDNNGTAKAGHEQDFLIAPVPASLSGKNYPVGSAANCVSAPTDTPVPPTNTPVPPTDTPVPPTNTPVDPTETPEGPTETPTETPEGPTETPVDPTETPEGPTETPTEPPTAWVPFPNEPAVCVDWLVYHTDITGDWEIFRLGDLPDGQTGDPNLSKGVDAFDVAPSRSPDNLSIAFASNRDGNWEIYMATVDGQLTERVTYNSEAIDIDPVWSPAGTLVAYESNRGDNWEIYLVDTQTGAERLLVSSDGNDLNPFWSPDGSQLLFQSDRSGQWQIYVLDLASDEVTLLSDGIGDDLDPQYSFDGQKIAFRSFRDGEDSAIYIMDADGQNVELISELGGEASNHVWAPDDVAIGYQSNLDGDLDIYVYEFESGITRQVTDNDIPDYAPTWICNSATVVFTSDVSGDPNIFDAPALPIDLPAIDVENDAQQLTFDESADQYPQNAPAEENASRQGELPSPITH